MTDDDDPLIDISHESLIRQWERMSEWVEAEAESREMYRRVADAARTYHKHGQKCDLLWGGTQLQLALGWKSAREFYWYHLWRSTHQETETLKGHESDVISVAFSPDGRTLASGSSDKTVRLWEVSTRQPLATLKGHESSVWSVAFSPDGKTLASAGGGDEKKDFAIRLWFAATDEEVARQRNK